MLSGQVNASQMLAAFLGNVKEKLGQKIVKNDFSGELEKHLPSLAKTVEADPAKTGSGKMDSSGVQSGADTAGSSAEAGAGSSPAIQDKGLTVSSAKIKEKVEKSLSVSNPAIVETILANLHYPAQVRDQCQALLSKQGHITFQDLKSILNTQPDTNSGNPAQVPAATVRTLVESIVKASESAGGKTAAIGAGLMASIGVKPDGSYTRDELRDLLKKIVQASQQKQTQTVVPPSSTPVAAPTLTGGGQKTGQAVELVSSVLPSFLSGESKVSTQKILSGPATDSQKAISKAADLQVNAASGASAGSSSPEGGDLKQSGSSLDAGQRTVPGVEAMLQRGEEGAFKASVAAEPVPVQEKPADSVSVRLGVAADLAYAMKAGELLQQSGSGASAGASEGVSQKEVENSANQGGQDVAMFGKPVEKLAGGKEQPSENVISQTSGTKSEDQLVTLQQMNNSGGDGSDFYDKNAEAELFANASGEKGAGASAATLGGDGIAPIISSYTAPSEQAAGILNGASSQKVGAESGKTKDTGDSPAKDDLSVAKSGADSDKAAPAGGGATGGSVQGATAGGGNGASAASASSGTLSQQEALSMPAGLADQGTQSGGEQSSGSSSDSAASRSVSPASGTETLAGIEQAVFVRQGGGAVAKPIEESASGKDSSPAFAFAQTSTSNLQAINVATADNSAQNGFPLYDPYRAAELVSSMREQMGSGGRLVLEMDSDGLGKINLKVGARKDEISVEALTQSEPARLALVNHSVELRQDLRDQGLVLEKFMVDVNGGRQGRETGSQANQSGAQGRGAPRGTKSSAVKTAAAPIRSSVRTGRSQISLFA